MQALQVSEQTIILLKAIFEHLPPVRGVESRLEVSKVELLENVSSFLCVVSFPHLNVLL